MTTLTAPVAPPLAGNRNFGLLWFGEGVSVLGSMTTTLVFPLLAVTAFDAGPGIMGLLAAATWLPWLILSLPAGVWIDRGDPRRIMIAADLWSAAATLSVPLTWALGHLTLVHLVLAALGVGAGAVFFRTAYASLIPRVVAEADLESANSRLVGTEAAMQVAGPGVGGGLVAAVSAASAVLLDTLTFLISAVCLWRMDPTRMARPEASPREPMRSSVRTGLRVLGRDPYMRFMAWQGGVSNFALTGYGALMVLFLVRDLHLDAGWVGVVMALGSLGGLCGAGLARRISARLGQGPAMVLLQIVGGPTALLIALAQPGGLVGLVPLGAALVGVGVVGANVLRGAFRGRYIPAAIMARVVSATGLLNMGMMPLGGLAGGWLGAHLGVRGAIAALAGLHALASLAVLVGPYRPGRPLPDRPMRC